MDRLEGLVDTPADTPFPNRQVAEIEGKITDLGKLEATVRLTIARRRRTGLARGFPPHPLQPVEGPGAESRRVSTACPAR